MLNSASEELGPNRELGVLVVQAYKQVRRRVLVPMSFHFYVKCLFYQVMSSFLHRLSLSESAVTDGAANLTDLQKLFVSSRHAKYLLQAPILTPCLLSRKFLQLFSSWPRVGSCAAVRSQVHGWPALPATGRRSALSSHATGSGSVPSHCPGLVEGGRGCFPRRAGQGPTQVRI